MKMKSVLFVWIALLPVGALGIASHAYAFDNTSVSGTVVCASTVFVKSSATASGQIALVADGQGNYVSGSESYQLAGGGGCDYVLDNGTYQVNPDGSGESTTDWLLVRNNSSQGCTHVVRGTSSVFSLVTNSFTADLHGNRSESGTCTLQ
jgi:hypothetical protein